MGRLRLSFTEKRRARLRKQVDRLDQLETRNTITEPISVTGLSLSALRGLAQLGIMRVGGGDHGLLGSAPPAGPASTSPRATGTWNPAPHAGAGPLPIAIVPRYAAPGGGGSSAQPAAATPAPKPAPAGDWLTLTKPADPQATESGLSTPWHPVRSTGGGLALPPRGGSGNGAPAATIAAIQGQITALRVPPPPDAASGAAGSGALLAAVASASRSGGTVPAGPPVTASRSPLGAAPGTPPAAPSPGPAAPVIPFDGPGGGVASGSTDPTPSTGGPTVVGGNLTSAPYHVTGNSSPGALGSFSYFPMYTLDYNNGIVLFPNADQYANPGGNVDLRA